MTERVCTSLEMKVACADVMMGLACTDGATERVRADATEDYQNPHDQVYKKPKVYLDCMGLTTRGHSTGHKECRGLLSCWAHVDSMMASWKQKVHDNAAGSDLVTKRALAACMDPATDLAHTMTNRKSRRTSRATARECVNTVQNPAMSTEDDTKVVTRRAAPMVPTHRALSMVPTHRALSMVPIRRALSMVPTHRALWIVSTHQALSMVPMRRAMSMVPMHRALEMRSLARGVHNRRSND